MEKSTAAAIIHHVCKVIWRKLKNIVMSQLTKEKWLEISKGFEQIAKFPNCIGALNSKHIRLIHPQYSGSLYYNSKHFFSLVLMALCDSNYYFIWVDIGAYGKNSDCGIFKESSLYTKLIKKTFNISEPRPITDNDKIKLLYVIVADEAFGMLENLMRLYGGNLLSHEKKIYNYRHTLALRYIECTFGIMSNKWRILYRPLDVNIEFAQYIVKAICVFHNYVRIRNGNSYEETLFTAP